MADGREGASEERVSRSHASKRVHKRRSGSSAATPVFRGPKSSSDQERADGVPDPAPASEPDAQSKQERASKAKPTVRARKPKVGAAAGSGSKSKRPSVASARVAQSKTRAQRVAQEEALRAGEAPGQTASTSSEEPRADSQHEAPERPEGVSSPVFERVESVAPDSESEGGDPAASEPPSASEPVSAPASSESVIDGLREESQERPTKRRMPFSFTPLKMTLAVVALACAVLIVLSAAFCWNRWWRYDDAADFKGLWFVQGTSVPVAIDDASIKLSDDVSYSYAIDQGAKTIAFDFGNMKGSGRYYFSDDRRQLVVIDGGSYTALSTLTEDMGRAFATLQERVSGREPEIPSGEGVSVFVRQPSEVPSETDEAPDEPAEVREEGADVPSG
ncbi:hypothetical protein [Gordonibacter sp. Marseille-P4307]|uniref:hypothetical protein n=1 Tax=Gordonibacter sp. Marseille-P4307 TaxID=2161815 RepID=UPI000F54B462|nr:hypothetical protein [Gordonibacter sp. Marseille-P4307]